MRNSARYKIMPSSTKPKKKLKEKVWKKKKKSRPIFLWNIGRDVFNFLKIEGYFCDLELLYCHWFNKAENVPYFLLPGCEVLCSYQEAGHWLKGRNSRLSWRYGTGDGEGRELEAHISKTKTKTGPRLDTRALCRQLWKRKRIQ